MAAITGEVLWRNPTPEKTQMFAFMKALGGKKGLNLKANYISQVFTCYWSLIIANHPFAADL